VSTTPIVARITLVAVRPPIGRTQVQLDIAVHARDVRAGEHRIAEVGSGAAATPAFVHYAIVLAVRGKQRRLAPLASAQRATSSASRPTPSTRRSLVIRLACLLLTHWRAATVTY